MKSTVIHPQTAAIEMTGVTVGARGEPDQAVLENVNWSVAAGDYWVIGGLQGSGKTSLLCLAAGLTAPLRGNYRLFGVNMPVFGDQFLPERLRIGLVFDGGQLFHRLSVLENIALPLRYHHGPSAAEFTARIEAVLEITGLTPWAGHFPGTLGRAWQKRVGLARALVLRPEILLLDNPMSGLDSRHIQWWLDFMGQLSSGHEFLEKRPATLITAAEDLRPWRNHSAHFALVQKPGFRSIGSHPRLTELNEPLVKELLAEPLIAA
jgi:putative ABC transport system ATP-binding protein